MIEPAKEEVNVQPGKQCPTGYLGLSSDLPQTAAGAATLSDKEQRGRDYKVAWAAEMSKGPDRVWSLLIHMINCRHRESQRTN